jgi:hypothetical protein
VKYEEYKAAVNVEPTGPSRVILDPIDPFEAALIPIVEMNRRKRADYAKDGDPFSNFKMSSALMGIEGFGPVEAALHNVTQKLARLCALRSNNRDPKNEGVEDTYLDLAVYGTITYAIYKERLAEET